MTPDLRSSWKRRVSQLKIEAYAIYLAYKDPRVPWYAKILIACVIGYAFSPIDKLLSSIPIIGYLDHLVLVPLGVVLAFKKMIPPELFTDCREKARIAVSRRKLHWVDGSIITVISFLFAALAIISTIWILKDWNFVIEQWIRWFTREITWQRLPDLKFLQDIL